MHPYSINSPRWRKIGYLMLVTLALSGPFNGFIHRIVATIPSLGVSSYPSAIPTLTLFSVLYLLWDRYLWRAPIISQFTDPPDLEGTWTAEIESDFDQLKLRQYSTDGGTDSESPKFVIKQSWTKISVTGYFVDSTSVSTTASFIEDHSDPVLRITYRNTPSANSPQAMTMHSGTNDLRYSVSDGCEYLIGKYYTDEHRNNHGAIRLQRQN